MPDDPNLGLFKTISHGLKEKPAYQLIFALSALFFIFSFSSAVVAAMQNSTQLWSFAFAGLLVSFIAAIIVIVKIEPKPAPPAPLVPVNGLPLRKPTGNETFDDVLDAIHNGVGNALAIKNAIFHEAMLDKCAELRALAAEWSVGQIHVRDQYNRLLIRFYESAQGNVFSTSVPGYLSAWNSPFGEKLMEAHRRSRAAVSRVFIFNNRAEITEEALAVMSRQMEAGIRVRVHFSDESKFFTLPPEIGNDFTVIDNGEAIGVTIALGAERLAATWYIQDQNKKQRFELTCAALTRDSEDFHKFSNFLKQVP